MRTLDESKKRELKSASRREVLKLSPLLLMGAFGVPSLRDPLLKSGLAFTDWAFRKMVPAQSPGAHLFA